MKEPSKDRRQEIWRLERLIEQTGRLYGKEVPVAVEPEFLRDLIEAWRWLNSRGDNEFPILYAGPGRHPDHPMAGCGGVCGHLSNCATHNSPDYLDGPCNCRGRDEVLHR